MGGGGDGVSELPTFDLGPFLEQSAKGSDLDDAVLETCKKLAECLRDTSALIVKDPRCPSEYNAQFLDMLEKYYEQPDALKKPDERPELHYQVGVTPEGIELPICANDPKCHASIAEQDEENRATVPQGPDPKWRYMTRIGERPKVTKFAELNAEPVIPKQFPEWVPTMDMWGSKMVAALEVVAEMAALGYGLERGAFREKMKLAPHLLAPTGSDLNKYTEVGTVFAGYHYDLNFLTIHGKSRFPGLYVWLRDGRRVPVKIPEGCLLIQAGKQIEWLTGGHVLAGMHEVVYSEGTKGVVERKKASGESLWRVSSTVFGHIASDAILEPLGHFATEEARAKYRTLCAGDQVQAELDAIKLVPNGLPPASK